MKKKKTRHTKEFKFKIALEAIKAEKTIAELAAEHQIHPQQIITWKNELLEKGADVFASIKESNTKQIEKERDQLYKTIGHQQVRIDWLKKTLGINHDPFGES